MGMAFLRTPFGLLAVAPPPNPREIHYKSDNHNVFFSISPTRRSFPFLFMFSFSFPAIYDLPLHVFFVRK